MPIQAIAFDLDGTLIHSLPDLAASANHVRAHFGLDPLPEDEIAAYIGDGVKDLIHRSLAGSKTGKDEARIDEGLAVHREFYGQHLTVNTVPYPGVRDALLALHEQNIPMAVVTNKPEKQAREILQTLELAPFFQAVFGGDTLPVRKPDPAPVLAAADALGVNPASLLMAGDSTNDMLSGKAAGCPTLLVTYGYADVPALKENPDTAPDYAIDDFADLPVLLNTAL